MVQRPLPPVLAFASRKGGTAKTSVAVNVSAALAELGARVLLVDLDSQANATVWLGVDEDRNLAEVLADGAELVPVRSPVDGVDVVPSSGLWLQKAERVLAGEISPETIFRDALAKALPGPWDVVVLDTPPALGIATTSALVAASSVLIPVESSAVSLQGVRGVVESLKAVRRLNPNVGIGGVVMGRLDRTRLGREVLESLRAKFGEKFVPVCVRDRVTVREAWGHRQPVTQYDPQGDAAEDYRELAQWIANTYSLALRATCDPLATRATQASHATP